MTTEYVNHPHKAFASVAVQDKGFLKPAYCFVLYSSSFIVLQGIC